MSSLNERNLQQFNNQMLGKRRQGSLTSRRSSIASSRSDRTKDSEPQQLSAAAIRWRRMSYAFSTTAFHRHFGQRSTTGSQRSKPTVSRENTYKLQPDDGTTFRSSAVEKILKDLLESRLSDKQYSPTTVSIVTQDLVNEIKRRVKELHMPRYKIVCQLYMGPLTGQGMEIATRAVWDKTTDNFASASFENQTMYAVAIVHGLYYE
ncbi:dynein light chain Tctex-type 5-B-like [Diadema setosum]|uniref:dynein light chain Tctex-type 5-B-like n=1 Tax=Diadema setosum TaxID=31175 RepID=UPI003B3B2322